MMKSSPGDRVMVDLKCPSCGGAAIAQVNAEDDDRYFCPREGKLWVIWEDTEGFQIAK